MTTLQEIETALFHAHVSRCTSYAGVALLAYDYTLTFSDEVRYVWRRPGNFVSILFLINRYLTPLVLAVDVYDKGGLTTHLDEHFCKIWFIVDGYLNFLMLAVVHYIMTMRADALYGGRRAIRILLYTAYTLYFVSTFSILTPGMVQAVKTFYAENVFLHVCWGQLVHYFWLTWVPALVLESLIFFLTILKVWKHSRANIYVPIAIILYRDGFQYYIVILLCSLFPLLVWTLAPSTLDAMPKYASFAIVNTMSFRLVLNLRRHSGSGSNVSSANTYEMSNNPSSRSHHPSEGSYPRATRNKTDLESYWDLTEFSDHLGVGNKQTGVDGATQSMQSCRSAELALELADRFPAPPPMFRLGDSQSHMF